MSEQQHTPEPWRVEIGEQSEAIALLCTSGLAHFEIVSDSPLGDIGADARRIAACVNACAGIPTELLERFKAIIGAMDEVSNIEKQRNELLAMLERCIPHVNPKVADKSLFSVKPMSECYLNTLATRLVEKIKGGAA